MKIAKDSIWLLAARVGTQGMAALFTILLARRLGSAGFGEYAVLAAVVFIGNMLTTFGTDMSIIREIAVHDDLSSLPSALAVQLALSLLFITVTWFLAPLILTESPNALRFYVFALIPLSFFTVFTSVLRGKQFMDAYMWLNLSGSILQFIPVWIFVGPNTAVETLAFLLLAAQSITALVGALICHWKVGGFWADWRFDLKDISHLLKASSPLAVLTVIAMFQQKSSVLMLSTIGGPAVTGIFSAAQKTVEAAKTGHSAVFTAMYPEMARGNDFSRVGGERPHLPDLLSKSRAVPGKSLLQFLILGAVIGAAALSVWAMPVTRILFGAGYEASVPAMQILAWVLIPYTANTFMTLKFIAMKKESPVLRASSISLVVLIACSLLSIPRMGAVGACSSALVAELLQAMILFYNGGRHEFSKLSR
jgi:O-antigen/teichoic acid export membrane protein